MLIPPIAIGDTLDLGEGFMGPIVHTFGPESFAVMWRPTDGQRDVALTWETAESMVINDGYVAYVLPWVDNGYGDADHWQARLTHEHALYLDCWGN